MEKIMNENKSVEELIKELEYYKNYDPVTKLPNRKYFMSLLTNSNIHNYMIIYLDIDNFKKLNSFYDYKFGDEILLNVAKIITEIAEDSNLVSHFGNDEFVIVLQDRANHIDIIEKLQDKLKNSIKINKKFLNLTASFGISFYPHDSADTSEIVKLAELAMQRAKKEGGNKCSYYSFDMTSKLLKNEKLKDDLHIAIKKNQFLTFYQPQFDIVANKVIGAETLVRWNHPKLGILQPGEFVPFAQDAGIMADIDDIVTSRALEQFLDWRSKGYELDKISVNLTIKHLAKGDYIDNLVYQMGRLGFNPEWLELEVVESEIMDNPSLIIDKLSVLNNLGISIAMDDFGTGYSSLSYLKKIPLSVLKIDRSFIKDLPYNEEDIAIAKMIIALGRSLDLLVLAEGVEDEKQKDFLLNNHCYYVQGYYYAKPMTPKDIEQILSGNSSIRKTEISTLPKSELTEFAKEIESEKENQIPNEIKIITNGGSELWFQDKVVPYINKDGEVCGRVMIRQDITERKLYERLSIIDTLTGLYNRRHFNNVLRREVKRRQREQGVLAFLMFDIDFFKKYNDSHGHKAGDDVLARVSRLIKKSLKRGSDYAFRIGGEEFGFIFSTDDKEKAAKFSEVIRNKIEDLQIENSQSPFKVVTVSVGLLVVDFAVETVDENGFYTMADDALYEAKRRGRNQVVVYGEDEDDVDFF